MSTVYTGNSANVTTPLAATLNGATNASPIVCSTTANHLFGTGDTVSITGAVGNTAANGTWTIIVLSPTTFSLTGSTGNGAWSSGGTVKGLSLTPQTTLPSDGDAFNAAAWNVPIQTCLDRTQYLVLKSSPLPTLAALASILAPTDGAVRIVRGQGTYVFDTTATTGTSPWRVAAADATPGGWVSASVYPTTRTQWVSAVGTYIISPFSDLTTTTGWYADASMLYMIDATHTATGTDVILGSLPSVIDGATLTSVVFHYMLAGTSRAPSPPLSFKIRRVNKAAPGNTVDQLFSVTPVADYGGTYGANTSKAYAPDQNNVIDVSNYYYQWQLTGESLINLNRVYGFELVYSVPHSGG